MAVAFAFILFCTYRKCCRGFRNTIRYGRLDFVGTINFCWHCIVVGCPWGKLVSAQVLHLRLLWMSNNPVLLLLLLMVAQDWVKSIKKCLKEITEIIMYFLTLNCSVLVLLYNTSSTLWVGEGSWKKNTLCMLVKGWTTPKWCMVYFE